MSSASIMLSNFRREYSCRPTPQHEQQPLLSRTDSQDEEMDIEYPGFSNQRWHGDRVNEETSCTAGCTCAFCSRRSENNTDADHRGGPMMSRARSLGQPLLPSTRSIVRVLYPSSYLGTYRPFPDPPLYSPRNSSPSLSRANDGKENFSLISNSTGIEGTPLLPTQPDPLAEDPSLTGVPSQATLPGGGLFSVEPNPPVVGSDTDVPDEPLEPLPAYSRFDQRRPRFPTASDVLGPYPPLPVLRRAAP